MQTSHVESVRFHSSDISQVVLYVLIVVDIYLVLEYQYTGIWKIPNMKVFGVVVLRIAA